MPNRSRAPRAGCRCFELCTYPGITHFFSVRPDVVTSAELTDEGLVLGDLSPKQRPQRIWLRLVVPEPRLHAHVCELVGEEVAALKVAVTVEGEGAYSSS